MDLICQHDRVVAAVKVERLDGDGPTVWQAELGFACGQCNERFIFLGVPVGISTMTPSTSPDGTAAMLPLAPASAVHAVSDN